LSMEYSANVDGYQSYWVLSTFIQSDGHWDCSDSQNIGTIATP